MAKRKSSTNLKGEWEDITMSSGVELRIRPFPIGIFEKINEDMLEEYPDIKPPKKTIPVLDGTEEVDDETNPEYLEKVKENEQGRTRFSGDRTLAYMLDFCIEVLPNLDHWESTIKRLEKHQGPFPDDSYDKRKEFLTSYAIGSKSDYEKLTFSTMAQSLIDDPEVAKRLKSFRSDMARSTNSNSDAPGSIENERVEVVTTTEGA